MTSAAGGTGHGPRPLQSRRRPCLQTLQSNSSRQTQHWQSSLRRTHGANQFAHRLRTHGEYQQVRAFDRRSEVQLDCDAKFFLQLSQLLRMPIMGNELGTKIRRREARKQRRSNAPAAEEDDGVHAISEQASAAASSSASTSVWECAVR